eukprot:c16472_g1_i1.p1 GENE.c16472_g1_i1~~c16472_g1_i1.p1  ORF type:complete len:159 (+),score=39.04 c16472_g1_i1:45-521(+)
MKLMVCVDGSANSDVAFEKAAQLKKAEDELFIVHACVSSEAFLIIAAGAFGSFSFIDSTLFDQERKAVEAHGAEVLDQYMGHCKEKNITATPILLKGAGAREAVCQFAEKREISTIFLGKRGISTSPLAKVGSFASYILSHATCDVILVKDSSFKESI